MVKSDLIEKLCDLHPNILHKDIEKIVNLVFIEIGEALKKGMRYEIRGFGTFKLKFRKARNDARNPKTGKKIIMVHPAYDLCIKASHFFNLLDARGVISVTERQAYISRVRNLTKKCADAFVQTAAGGQKN